MIQIPLEERAGLWTLCLRRLHELKIAIKYNSQSDYIPYNVVAEGICRNFSIKKQTLFELLLFLQELGFVKLSCGHGVKLMYEIKDNQISCNLSPNT